MFGKPCTCIPCTDRIPSRQYSDRLIAAWADHVVAGLAACSRCRPRSRWHRSGSRSGTPARRRSRPWASCASTPRPSVSTSETLGRLNAWRYSSWKHGRLQNCRYHGLRASAVAGSVTIASTRDRICSIFSKSASSRMVARSWPDPADRSRSLVTSFPMMSVQPSMTRSCSAKPPEVSSVKFSIRSRCHPGPSDAAHDASVGRFARTSMEEGVRWKTNSSPAEAATWGTTWTAVAPVPMMPTRLSARPSSPPFESPPVYE